MPNLYQTQALRKKYRILKGDFEREMDVLDKAIDVLASNFSNSYSDIRKAFLKKNLPTDILYYLDQQASTYAVLIFIDITGFSTKCANLENEELSLYLDKYYERVIPIIYKHGGEVEKIIGDGIISIFGMPFLKGNADIQFKQADKCCKDIIMELKGSDKEVKIALRRGRITYYKFKTELYPEYTIIGKPLTELFRLESVSENNSINFYSSSLYDTKKYSEDGTYIMSYGYCRGIWKKSDSVSISLKGVSEKNKKHLECTFTTKQHQNEQNRKLLEHTQ